MPEASLSCYTRREGRSITLAIEGCLDIATAPQATEFLQKSLTEHGPNLVVDTSRLDFIDSKGVGALLSAAKASRDAGGQIYMHEPALPVKKILDMCGLQALFPPPPASHLEAALPTETETAKPAPRSSAPRTGTRAPRKVA